MKNSQKTCRRNKKIPGNQQKTFIRPHHHSSGQKHLQVRCGSRIKMNNQMA
jgi:hypothetical protein